MNPAMCSPIITGYRGLYAHKQCLQHAAPKDAGKSVCDCSERASEMRAEGAGEPHAELGGIASLRAT